MTVNIEDMSLKLKMVYSLDWFPYFSLKEWAESKGIPDVQIGINGRLYVRISGDLNPNFYQDLFEMSNIEQVRNRIGVQETSFKRVVMGEEKEPNLKLLFKHSNDGYNPARWLGEAMDCHNVVFGTTEDRTGKKTAFKANEVKISVQDLLCLLGPKEIQRWFPI